MERENEHLDNDHSARMAFEHEFMLIKSEIEQLNNKHNTTFKTYENIQKETNNYSQKINALIKLTEQEIKISQSYQSHATDSKCNTDNTNLEVTKTEIHLLNYDSKELTKEQRLKIKTNRNAALILTLEKQLNALNLNLDERKANFTTTYKKYLLRKYN